MNYIQRFVQDRDNGIKAIRALVMLGILIALINTLTIKNYIIYIFPIALFIMAAIVQFYLSNHNKYTSDMIKYLEEHENYSKLYVRFTGNNNFDDKLIMSINGEENYTLGKDNYGIFIFIDYTDEDTEIIIDEAELFKRLGLDIEPSEIRVSKVLHELEKDEIEGVEYSDEGLFINLKDKITKNDLESELEDEESTKDLEDTTEDIETEEIESDIEENNTEDDEEIDTEENIDEENKEEEVEKIEIRAEEEIIIGQMVKYHFKGDFGRYMIRYDQLTDNYYINYFY